jgi:adenine-specific DNA-methyltransferase
VNRSLLMSATQKPEKLSLESFDPVQGNLAQLAQLMPNCITETTDAQGKIKYAVDFDLLRQALSSELVEGPQERYRLDWPGKRQALVEANTRIDKTLRPAPYESVNFDTTENLYIEGDNLEALKLLQNTYMGKIKMIYIDPPYNTGNDFIYKDNFKTDQASHDGASEVVDEEGNRLFQAEKFVQNTESNGRYHSDWLSMMYPRLKVARDLLSEDGVIFISIDDNEVHNLRKICDEVFGEGNILLPYVWELPRGINAGHISKSHEYFLVYAKIKEKLQPFKKIGESEFSIERCNKRIDARHPASDITFPAGIRYEGEDKTIKGEISGSELVLIKGTMIFRNGVLVEPVTQTAGWTMKNMIERWLAGESVLDSKGQPISEFFFKENGKLYSKKEMLFQSVKSLLKGFSDYQDARDELEGLLGSQDYFDYPKPTKIINKIASHVLEQDDIILDFFSGSATTAHAVMQLNAEDGGNRKFILVQIPELTPENSEARKAGYATIAEIGKERIRRAGQKIKAENQGKPGIENLDIGFRVLKVDESNFKPVKQTAQAMTQQDLLNNANNINEDIKGLDLLFQVMLARSGLMLSAHIEEKQIQGSTVYLVNETDLIACFDTTITEALAHEITALQPLNVVFRNSDFSGDDTLINIHQIFKLKSSHTKVKVV